MRSSVALSASSASLSRRACVIGAALSLVVACSSPPQATDPSRLPLYGAEDAALLDDGFSGHLFETAFVPGTAGDDPRFEDRVRAAHSVWLVKVATVSREGSFGNNRRYEVTMRTLEGLSGPPAPPQVTLTISGKDPSFHWLDRVGGAWVGRELLLLTRNYRPPSAHAEARDGVMHFHGEPNTPELRARIQRIQAADLAAERAARSSKK
ncbi:MAG TPA: hypothetical protein VER96_41330 [Polyangiaceae bacterium]|nr:hypothetical protein [Polyangiaceae bacterium]